MIEQVIKVLVEGGKANPSAMGQSLGVAGLNIGKVVADINNATKDYAGMKVPVKIIYDSQRNYRLEVGVPPTSQLLKKEAGIEKGAGDREAAIGDLTIEQAVKVARQKQSQMMGTDLKKNVKEVLGVCVSMGLTVEGRNPKIVQKEIDEGKHDDRIK